jgi:hypothetical protein
MFSQNKTVLVQNPYDSYMVAAILHTVAITDTQLMRKCTWQLNPMQNNRRK